MNDKPFTLGDRTVGSSSDQAVFEMHEYSTFRYGQLTVVKGDVTVRIVDLKGRCKKR